MTPRPICIDCGHEAIVGGDGSEIWTVNDDGNWQCDDCWHRENMELNENGELILTEKAWIKKINSYKK